MNRPFSLAVPLISSALALALAACAHAPAEPSKSEAKNVAVAEPELSPHDRQIFFINDVRRGNCEAIAPALAKGADINGFDSLDQTALIAAVSQGHLDCVTQLLDKGADVNLADHAGWSPLIHASYFGANLDLMVLLLDRGANVNAQNGRGLTGLYLATAAGHELTVRLLLAKGADTQLASQSGYTPLRVAQLRGLDRIAALLEGKQVPLQPTNAAAPASSTAKPAATTAAR